MTVLLTGAAGFIGYHVAERLLARGERVVGVDIVNDYYDPALKEARLSRLAPHRAFSLHRVNIADREAMEAVLAANPDIDRIVHLAAQAGVRYSLVNPYAYVEANVMGHVVMLERARSLQEAGRLRHFVYASSSSVYGGNTKLPFAVEDRVDTPISLYAATKRSDELMSHAYAHLFRIPITGLRFFTVYGPWGRPDMAAYLFARAITRGEPITVYNNGNMKRDFTYVDDIVAGVVACLDRPPAEGNDGAPPARIYNIGNHRSEPLMRFIGLIEAALGRKAEIRFAPKPPADVLESFADIEAIGRDVGYRPTTPIDVGIPRFIEWFRAYHRM